MIELVANIDISKVVTEKLSTEENSSRNNISAASMPIGAKKYQEPFILGSSKLGGGSRFCEESAIFIGNVASNEQGVFSPSYEFNFDFTNTLSEAFVISLAFDTNGNGHPQSITVDGETIYDDDAIFNFKLASNETHTIVIDNWNKPNSPLIISGIYSVIKGEINKRNAISIECSLSQRGEFQVPDYGLYSSSARIEFKDTTGEYEDYASLGILSEGCKTEFKLQNTLDKATKNRPPIGTYYTSKWSYDANNRTVSVELKDNLELLQDVQGSSMMLPNETTMYEVFSELKDKTIEYFEFADLSATVEGRLTNVTNRNVTMHAKSLWAQWEDFCIANALYMFLDNYGKVKFSYNLNGD